MRTIAIVSRKGGVGKTATAHALGAGLARKGYSVLYVDLDSQTNLSKGLGADLTGASVLDLLLGDARAGEVIQETPQGDVMAAGEDLAGADAFIKGSRKEYRLKDALRELPYDYVIIDTPAALGALTVNALTAADCVVITAKADADSLDGLAQINKAVEAVKQRCNPGLYVDGILITLYKPRTIFGQDMLSNFKEAAKQMHTRVYAAPIRDNVAVSEAKYLQQDIFTYSPRSNGARDYGAFIDEFMTNERKNKT